VAEVPAGARARLQCKGPIPREDGLFRDHFKALKVIAAKAA
jgi:hypothetical protein